MSAKGEQNIALPESYYRIKDLKEKYFKQENRKFRNIVDGVQTHLIERDLTFERLEKVKEELRGESSEPDPFTIQCLEWVVDEQISIDDIIDAFDLAVFYYKKLDHTDTLRKLYKTILS